MHTDRKAVVGCCGPSASPTRASQTSVLSSCEAGPKNRLCIGYKRHHGVIRGPYAPISTLSAVTGPLQAWHGRYTPNNGKWARNACRRSNSKNSHHQPATSRLRTQTVLCTCDHLLYNSDRSITFDPFSTICSNWVRPANQHRASAHTVADEGKPSSLCFSSSHLLCALQQTMNSLRFRLRCLRHCLIRPSASQRIVAGAGDLRSTCNNSQSGAACEEALMRPTAAAPAGTAVGPLNSLTGPLCT